MNSLFKSFVGVLSLAALSAAPLHAEDADSENAKRRAAFLLAVKEKERLEEEIAARKPANTLNIVDTAAAAGSFKTLAAALEAAGLVDTLKGEGPFTVFAPTDEAFAKLPAGTVENLLKPENKAQLITFLTNHVVTGVFPLSKALEAGEGKTLQGSTLNVRSAEGRVKIGDSFLVNADIKTINGLIHVIDTVLIPSLPELPAPGPGVDIVTDEPKSAPSDQDIVDTAIAAGTFSRLFAALTAADLVDMLKGDGPYTVFAPTDEAFSKLGERSVNDLLMPANKPLLIDILSNHVVTGEIPLSKAVEAGKVTSLQGSQLKVHFEDGLMKVGRGRTKLIQPDIKTSNGVIHVVDSVLMHTNFLSIKLGMLQYDWKFTKTVALWGSKDIVLVFADSESDFGKQLDEMVFSKRDFFEASNKEFVFMKVENPRNKHLMNASEREEKTGLWKEFGVDVDGNTITVLLCDKDGVTYATTDYSKGSETEFLKHLHTLLDKHSKRD